MLHMAGNATGYSKMPDAGHALEPAVPSGADSQMQHAHTYLQALLLGSTGVLRPMSATVQVLTVFPGV